jgi:hypothetical protein
MITFKISPEDQAIVNKIVERARQLATQFNIEYPTHEISMDLTAAHEVSPLPLQKLLDTADTNLADFSHDVFGIHRHINRITGELQDAFVPRCAR